MKKERKGVKTFFFLPRFRRLSIRGVITARVRNFSRAKAIHSAAAKKKVISLSGSARLVFRYNIAQLPLCQGAQPAPFSTCHRIFRWRKFISGLFFSQLPFAFPWEASRKRLSQEKTSITTYQACLRASSQLNLLSTSTHMRHRMNSLASSLMSSQ